MMFMVMRKGRIKRIHTAKFKRCVEKVRKSKYDGRKYNVYAICTASLGKGAFLKKRR